MTRAVTTTIRESVTEIVLEPDQHNGLRVPSAVQCQHLRSAATKCLTARIGNIGPIVLHQLRRKPAILLDV